MTAAASRTRRTTSVELAAPAWRSRACARASRQVISQALVARASASTSAGSTRVGVAVLAAHLAQVGLLPGVEVGLVLGRRPAARRSRGAVSRSCARRLSVASCSPRSPAAFLGMHDGRVPVEDRQGALDAGDAA